MNNFYSNIVSSNNKHKLLDAKYEVNVEKTQLEIMP